MVSGDRVLDRLLFVDDLVDIPVLLLVRLLVRLLDGLVVCRVLDVSGELQR